MSQIRNCGERTFPNAAKAVTAAAHRDDEALLPSPAPRAEEDPDGDERRELDERRERRDERPAASRRARTRSR